MLSKRITEAAAWCQVEYATICPWSAQNKWLLLQDGRGFYAFYTGAGEYVDMPHLLGHNSECRWDSNDPDTLYYLVGNTINQHNARTHESSQVQFFNEYAMFAAGERNGVQGLGEGDIENNKWALAGMRKDGKRDVFLYDLNARTKGGVLTLEPDGSAPTVKHSGRAHGLDNVYATPGGNVQIGWYASGKDRFQGVELYDGQTMEFIRQLATVMSHNDTASYQGRDILLWGSSADAKINANAIWAIDNQTGDKRMLINLEWSEAFHVSACARDFAIVSTYAPDNSRRSQIMKVRLNGSGSEVLCDTGSVMMRNEAGGMAYNPTPRASVSRDGSRVVFNSNSGVLDRGVNYVDVFMLTLETANVPRPQPQPDPIIVQPDRSEIVALQTELSLARTAIVRAQEGQRVATAQVLGLRRDVEALERRLADPEPDPDIWPIIDFLQRGHLPGQRWGFQLNDNGTLKMFDVMNGEWLAIAIPEGNQYLFVQTADGLEQYKRKTNTK